MTTTPDTPKPARDTGAALIRGVQMLVFAILFAVAETALAVIAVLQLGWLLATGAANPALSRFGRSFSTWLAAVVAFQTAASDDKPFPWAEWPKDG